MGIQASYIKTLLVNQSSKEECLPVTPYSKFPQENWTVGNNNLLMDIHVYPDKLQRCNDDGSWYWWCDAEFRPFNDSCIFATASAFQPRATRHWVAVPSMPNGRILAYQLPSVDHIRCQLFSRTTCSVYPKVQPHPIGELVCYCGTGEVVVMGGDGDPLFQRSRDLSNAVHVYCAVAKNGISFACLKRGTGVFLLETYLLQSTMAANSFIRCNTVCPGFIPSRNVSDGVQCKFSPDSKYIAVSSSTGFLFTVTRSTLEKHCIICPELVQQMLSAAGSFDYHPCFPSQIMTVATLDKNVHIINLDTKEVLYMLEFERHVDCIRYSPDGSRLALAFNNFDINVLNSEDLSCIHKFEMSELCETAVQRTHPNFQSVLNLSFSQTGERLVSSSCDGHIRLWLIPKLLSLQEICRNSILSSVNINQVKKLKLPSKLTSFLLYKYF